jgi:hypothetical protein
MRRQRDTHLAHYPVKSAAVALPGRGNRSYRPARIMVPPMMAPTSTGSA